MDSVKNQSLFLCWSSYHIEFQQTAVSVIEIVCIISITFIELVQLEFVIEVLVIVSKLLCNAKDESNVC